MWYKIFKFERKNVKSQLHVAGWELVDANSQQGRTEPPGS